MSDQNFIERNSTKITDILLEVQERTIAELYALKGSKSAEEFIRLIEGLDVKAIVNAKAVNAIGTFQISHTGMLESIEGFATIPEATIQALANFNAESLLSHIDNMSVIIKKEVLKGAISGVGVADILKAVRGQGSLSDRQLRTLITTAMNEYSRSVTKVMMDQMPKETLYVYIGALDEKTRPICLEMMSANKLTLSQIGSNFGSNVLTSGGGYNCRHKWEISVQDKFGHDPNKAQNMLDKLNG